MPLTYRIDHANRLIFTDATGSVSYADAKVHLQNKLDNGTLSYGELVDARGAINELTSAEVVSFADDLKRIAESHFFGPVAVVVSSDLNFGVTRQIGALAQTVCAIEPFRDMAEAEAWLMGSGDTTQERKLLLTHPV